MNDAQQHRQVSIPMYDLLDIACAAHAALELEHPGDKEHAFKHVLHRTYGYLSPEARADFQAWVERKGWRDKEVIILKAAP